jgi:hypothetical protein
MPRLYTLGTWSFSSLAIALALLVPLTVPEGALADAGSDCNTSCTASCNDDCVGEPPSCFANCMGQCTGTCCSDACTDNTCVTTCCSEACGSIVNCNSTCVALGSPPCGGTQGGGSTCANGCLGKNPADCAKGRSGCSANPGGIMCNCTCRNQRIGQPTTPCGCF